VLHSISRSGAAQSFNPVFHVSCSHSIRLHRLRGHLTHPAAAHPDMGMPSNKPLNVRGPACPRATAVVSGRRPTMHRVANRRRSLKRVACLNVRTTRRQLLVTSMPDRLSGGQLAPPFPLYTAMREPRQWQRVNCLKLHEHKSRSVRTNGDNCLPRSRERSTRRCAQPTRSRVVTRDVATAVAPPNDEDDGVRSDYD
jgi:hypothetical protein